MTDILVQANKIVEMADEKSQIEIATQLWDLIVELPSDRQLALFWQFAARTMDPPEFYDLWRQLYEWGEGQDLYGFVRRYLALGIGFSVLLVIQ